MAVDVLVTWQNDNLRQRILHRIEMMRCVTGKRHDEIPFKARPPRISKTAFCPSFFQTSQRYISCIGVCIQFSFIRKSRENEAG